MKDTGFTLHVKRWNVWTSLISSLVHFDDSRTVSTLVNDGWGLVVAGCPHPCVKLVSCLQSVVCPSGLYPLVLL